MLLVLLIAITKKKERYSPHGSWNLQATYSSNKTTKLKDTHTNSCKYIHIPGRPLWVICCLGSGIVTELLNGLSFVTVVDWGTSSILWSLLHMTGEKVWSLIPQDTLSYKKINTCSFKLSKHWSTNWLCVGREGMGKEGEGESGEGGSIEQ